MFRMARVLLDKAGGEGASGAGAAGGNAGSSPNGGGDKGSGGGAGGSSGGGNAGGATDPLFGDGGGGTGNNGNNTGGSGGTPPAGGAPNSDKGASGGNNGPVFPANWKDALPQEIRESAYMKLVNDVPTLAQNYANVQKMIGADKVPIPGKDATTDEWKEAFHKLGNPRDLKEYNFEVDDATKAGMDEAFLEKFKETAHANGVLPRQAAALTKWFAELNKNAWSDVEKANNAKMQEGLEGLKKEWGGAYDGNLVRAKAAIAEFAGPEEAKMLRDLGLGRNATFLKFLAKVGTTLSEATIKGHGGQAFEGNLDPAQAQAKIKEITSNSKSPYFDKNHERHLEVKKEVDKLYSMAYPSVKNS